MVKRGEVATYSLLLRKAVKKGRDAFFMGKPQSDNPYTRFEFRFSWDDGWIAASHEVAAAKTKSDDVAD